MSAPDDGHDSAGESGDNDSVTDGNNHGSDLSDIGRYWLTFELLAWQMATRVVSYCGRRAPPAAYPGLSIGFGEDHF